MPVHSRQGEFDHLWISDDAQVAEFKTAFTSAPWVDARLVPNAGHCIDFHLAAKAFQLEQLAFAPRSRPARRASRGCPDRHVGHAGLITGCREPPSGSRHPSGGFGRPGYSSLSGRAAGASFIAGRSSA